MILHSLGTVTESAICEWVQRRNSITQFKLAQKYVTRIYQFAFSDPNSRGDWQSRNTIPRSLENGHNQHMEVLDRKSITRVHTGLPKLSHADMSSQGKYDEPEHHSARVSSIFLSIVWFLLLLGVTIHVNLSFRSLWTKVLTSTQVSIKPGCSDSGLKCQQQKKI